MAALLDSSSTILNHSLSSTTFRYPIKQLLALRYLRRRLEDAKFKFLQPALLGRQPGPNQLPARQARASSNTLSKPLPLSVRDVKEVEQLANTRRQKSRIVLSSGVVVELRKSTKASRTSPAIDSTQRAPNLPLSSVSAVKNGKRTRNKRTKAPCASSQPNLVSISVLEWLKNVVPPRSGRELQKPSQRERRVDSKGPETSRRPCSPPPASSIQLPRTPSPPSTPLQPLTSPITPITSPLTPFKKQKTTRGILEKYPTLLRLKPTYQRRGISPLFVEMSTNPTPLTWTIRLKQRTRTVLLHVDPLQRIDTIKAELLRALKQTSRDGMLYGLAIPEDASDVLLARPNDILDPQSGWTSLESDSATAKAPASEDEATKNGKGKGKAKATAPSTAAGNKRKRGTTAGALDCLQGLGLKDNAVLAFKFRQAREDRGGDNDDEGLDLEDEEWDVVIPSFEDQYGVENLGDVGAQGEFQG
ncbi:hypothetical protein LTR60_002948 [Cryomyces antarcticus]|nr:hypothetical protein LTR60_002948 [Cryomyces antarcticus]